MTVRRLAAALVISVTAVSCGRGSESGGPEVLTLGFAAYESRDAVLNDLTIPDLPLVPGVDVTYEVSPELDLDDPALNNVPDQQAWKFTVPNDPRDQLNRVVSVLVPANPPGTARKVREHPGKNGLYTVDIGDGFTFESWGDDHWRTWTYGSNSGVVSGDTVNDPCAPDQKDCTSVTSPPGEKTGGLPRSAANLPRSEKATELARTMTAGMGVPADSVRFSVSRDSWSVMVMAQHVFRGVDSPMSWYFAFGDNAELLRAGGPVFSVVRTDKYPVIDAKKAIERLNSDLGPLWYSHASLGRALAVDANGSVPQKVDVQLVSARMSLMPYWTKDGRQLMIPAWRFTTDKDDSVDVAAVVDEYLLWDDTPVTTAPVPGQSGSSGGGSSGSSGGSGGSAGSGGSVEPVPAPDEPKVTPPTATSAAKLIGLSEAEARKVCESLGWTMRVTRRDGEEFAVTLELNPLRVNVAVDRGIVSEITGIG